MIRPVRLFALLLLFTLAIRSAAQTADIHLVENPAKGLFQHSAWAHGYIHGYESGFHLGNLDLHMARAIQNPHRVKEYKKSHEAYRESFGNRPEFDKGYCAGFEVGFLDGSSGREFRAASEANLTSAAINSAESLDPKQAGHLDELLNSGYGQGRRNGLNDARSRLEFNRAEGACPDAAKTQSTCEAYKAGYRWGYSDGYSNQRPDLNTQWASK